MRVYRKTCGREAAPRDRVFVAFPPGKNDFPHEKRFGTIEELAIHLLKNPDWKVWLSPNAAHKDGQLSSEIVIEGSFDRDNLKARGLL